MKCESARERFSEYIDDALESEQRTALESHLAQCAECRRELRAWRRTTEAVKGLPRHSVPRGFAHRLMARLGAGGAARVPARRIVSLWPRVAAVAAMLLLALGVIFVVGQGWLGGREEAARRGARRIAMVTGEEDRYEAAPVAEEGEEAPEIAAGAALGLPFEAKPKAAKGRYGGGGAPARPARESIPGELPKAPDMLDKRAASAARAPRLVAHEGIREGVTQTESSFEGAVQEPRRGDISEGLSVNGVSPVSGEMAEKVASKISERDLPRASPAGRAALAQARSKAGLREGSEGALLEAQPDQMLTIVADDPIAVAARAMRVAEQNDARGVRLSAPVGEEVEAAIVISLSVPARTYERFLQQVVEITPPQEQRLSNLMTAPGDEYFVRVAHSYVATQQSAMVRWETVQKKEVAGEPKPIASAEKERREVGAFSDLLGTAQDAEAAKDLEVITPPGDVPLGEAARRIEEQTQAVLDKGAEEKADAEAVERLYTWRNAQQLERQVAGKAGRQEQQRFRALRVPREVRLVINVVRRTVRRPLARPTAPAAEVEEGAEPARKPAAAE